MATNIIHASFGMFSVVMVWGGLAVAAAIIVFLMISESSSGVRPPGCQRGAHAQKPVR